MGAARVSDFFFTKNPIFFYERVGWGGGLSK